MATCESCCVCRSVFNTVSSKNKRSYFMELVLLSKLSILPEVYLHEKRSCSDINHRSLRSMEIVRVDTPGLINPVSATEEKTVNCLYCTSAPVTLSVKTDKGGYSVGEKIAITEDDECRRRMHVLARLQRKTTYHFRTTGKSHSVYSTIYTKIFTTTNTLYMQIPSSVDIPSIDCEILKVSYFVTHTWIQTISCF